VGAPEDAGPDRRQGQGAGHLRTALKEGTLVLPDAFARRGKIRSQTLLHKLAGKLDIKDAEQARHGQAARGVYLSDEFKALWDRIKHKHDLPRAVR
jgi:type III restriction enzyme